MNERKRQSSACGYRLRAWTSGALLEWYERVRAAAALARDARSLRAARERGDAPADPGAAGRAVLRALAGAVPDRAARWPRRRCATCCRCGAGWATTGARWRCSNAARVVASSGWPSDLTSLPGVGPYTAAAVVVVRVGRAGGGGRHERAARARRGATACAGAARVVGAGRVAAPGGPGGDVQPGDDGARRDGLPPARARVRGVPGLGGLPRAAAGRAAARKPAVRFEDTDRWARGRIVAALLAGEGPPVQGERLERALAGLERDGLIVRDPDGSPGFPDATSLRRAPYPERSWIGTGSSAATSPPGGAATTPRRWTSTSAASPTSSRPTSAAARPVDRRAAPPSRSA